MVRVAPRRGPGKVRRRYTAPAPPAVTNPAASAQIEAAHAEQAKLATQRHKNLITIPKPAARCAGGPWDGWVYFVADLQARKASYEAQGMYFGYYPTQAHTTLPGTGGIQGVVWRYRDAA
jgi:hypothetical protein